MAISTKGDIRQVIIDKDLGEKDGQNISHINHMYLFHSVFYIIKSFLAIP